MITVRDIIAKLEALAMPDAQVFAHDDGGAPFLLQGGYTGRTSSGMDYVVLAPRDLSSAEGGF